MTAAADSWMVFQIWKSPLSQFLILRKDWRIDFPKVLQQFSSKFSSEKKVLLEEYQPKALKINISDWLYLILRASSGAFQSQLQYQTNH